MATAEIVWFVRRNIASEIVCTVRCHGDLLVAVVLISLPSSAGILKLAIAGNVRCCCEEEDEDEDEVGVGFIPNCMPAVSLMKATPLFAYENRLLRIGLVPAQIGKP